MNRSSAFESASVTAPSKRLALPRRSTSPSLQSEAQAGQPALRPRKRGSGASGLIAGLLLASTLPLSAAETVGLETLDLAKMRQGWGQPQINRSMREQPLAIAGQSFARGVGTHAHSTLWLELAGGSERFLASVGVDDAANGPGSVQFLV